MALSRRPAGSSSLDAAGITDPQLREDLLACRALHAAHGRTYFLATGLLPPAKRPWVWALYGFARYADEFVDSLTDPRPEDLVSWSRTVLTRLRAARGADGDAAAGDPAGDAVAGATDVAGDAADDADGGPVGRAMAAAMARWDIPLATVEAFLASMRADISVTHYPTYADLQQYMYGSAEIVGLQMLPVLQPLPGLEDEAAACARTLGEAFQLSNFIRDVGEDLDRGRTYLPDEDLDAFGVDREQLIAGRRGTGAGPAVRELLRFEVDRNRDLYRRARPGIAMLHPTSRDAIACAFELYGGILGAVERADYQVLDRRVSVSVPRRLAVAVPALARARAARREQARWRVR